jgi:hypothetical protein
MFKISHLMSWAYFTICFILVIARKEKNCVIRVFQFQSSLDGDSTYHIFPIVGQLFENGRQRNVRICNFRKNEFFSEIVDCQFVVRKKISSVGSVVVRTNRHRGKRSFTGAENNQVFQILI